MNKLDIVVTDRNSFTWEHKLGAIKPINKEKIRHLSRDGKSSEQFVWRNLAYR
jgi:hypothetical protein